MKFLLLYDVPWHPATAAPSAEAGQPQYPLWGRHVGEEVRGVSEEDGFGVADGVYDGMVGNSTGFRFYFPGDKVHLIFFIFSALANLQLNKGKSCIVALSIIHVNYPST